MTIAPSIYNADLTSLEKTLAIFTSAGIRQVHIDIMDGNFVPALSFGTNIVKDLKKHSGFILDCHLMTEKPENIYLDYIEAGADMITVHIEATAHIFRIIQAIRQKNILAGVAINPGTPVSVLKEILPCIDYVLVMTINPGVAGEKFIASGIDKIRALYRLKKQRELSYKIGVDGNITENTAAACLRAGADILVAGGYIFNGGNIMQNIRTLSSVKDMP